MVCREGHREAAAPMATQLQCIMIPSPFSQATRLNPSAEAKVLQQLRGKEAGHKTLGVQRVRSVGSTGGDAALWGPGVQRRAVSPAGVLLWRTWNSVFLQPYFSNPKPVARWPNLWSEETIV